MAQKSNTAESQRGGSFLVAAATLLSGNVLGQMLVVGSSPLLTRLYGPGEFGVLGVYTAVVAYLVLMASLRYELAILLPRSDRIAEQILVLCGVILLFFTAGVTATIILLRQFAPEFSAGLLLSDYLWLLPLAAFAGGGYKILTFWSLRQKSFKLVAGTRLVQDGTMVSAQIGLAALPVAGNGLVVGYLLGISFAAASMTARKAKQIKNALRHVTRRRVFAMATRYRRFPAIMAWGDLANVTSKQLPVLMIASLFGIAPAGLYLLGNRVANVPVALVSDAVNKVFLSFGVGALHQGQLSTLSLRVFKALLKTSVVPFTLVAVIAPELFTLVFGAEWRDAGYFMQLLIPHIVAVFVCVPMLALFTVLERQSYALIFQIVLVLVSALSLGVGWLSGDVYLAVMLYGAGTAIVYFVFCLFVLHLAGAGIANALRIAIPELVLSILLVLSVIALRRFFDLAGEPLLAPPMLGFFAGYTMLLGWVLWRSRKAWFDLGVAQSAIETVKR